jgi:hypothetical protein
LFFVWASPLSTLSLDWESNDFEKALTTLT